MQQNILTIHPEDVGDAFSQFDYIELVGSEVINGVLCERYRGSYDYWGLDFYREIIENETNPEIKAATQVMLEAMEQEQEEEQRTAPTEIWLGKGDHVHRQTRNTISWTPTEDEDIEGTTVPAGTKITQVFSITFTNFNEPIEIEVPILE